MPLPSGFRLGPYEILASLGAGGMGEVYRARDARLGREVAIKVLPAAAAHDPQMLRRLEQEARTVAALNHPNLLSVYDIGTTAEGHPYIVSELLEGQSLRQRLAAGALGQSKAVEYAIQIARGLAAAHEKGIIHRDLKPENLFVTHDGRVKILDFGLAKMTAQAAAEEQTVAVAATTPGTVLGTVGYMSPEQVKGQAADARSDIFSFGAVLYEMLTGRRAFAGDSAVEVMSAILKEEPEPLDTTSTGKWAIAPGLDRIVRHCLEKEPRQRFQSADDLAFHLGDVAQASTSSLRALPAPRRPPRLATIAVAIAGAIGIAAAWYAARGTGRAEPPVLRQLTFQRDLVTGARFLPDQQGFVVSLHGGGAPDELYTGRLNSDGLQALNVPGEEVAALSNTGEALLLPQGPVYEFAGFGMLSRMPLDGDAPRPVLDNISAADWGRDGATMAIVRREAEANQETLEYPPGHVLYTTSGWINSIRISRDGQRVAFIEHSVFGDDRGRVAVVDRAGHARTLTPLYASANGLAWGPEGREIWYTAAPVGINRAIYAVDLQGHVRRLFAGPTTLELRDVAADGDALVASSEFRMTAMAVTPQQPAGRDLSVLAGTEVDDLSNDGRQALVTEFDTSIYSTYLRGTEGGAPVRLGDGYGEALSPDGRWALLQNPDTGQLSLVPTGAGAPRPLNRPGTFWHAMNSSGGLVPGGMDSFLPDSQSVIAVGNQPGRPARDYRIRLDGTSTPLTSEGVAGTWPTPDDRYVLAQRADGAWLLYPVAGGAPVPVPALQPSDTPLRFGATNDEVLLAEYGANQASVQCVRLHLRSGEREVLATVRPTDPGFVSLSGVVISQDGKTYVYAKITTPGSLYLISGLQ